MFWRFSKRRLEIGKNILLVLLAVSALFLASEAGIFDQLLGADPRGSIAGAPSPTPESGSDSAAALPFVMAVTLEDGSQMGEKYGAPETRALYERFKTPLGEALGSAGVPKEVAEDAWRAALLAPGVFFDYLYGQPLAALAGWLGTPVPDWATGVGARRICICAERGNTALYYIGAEDGKFYRCDTSASALQLDGLLPNGAGFVFASPGYSHIDPYTLLTGKTPGLADTPGLPALEGKNPVGDSVAVADVLTAFKLNSYVAAPLTETDGTTSYVEGLRTLNLSPDGTLTYQGDGEAFRLQGDQSLSAMVQAAFDFVSRSAGKWAGVATLQLSGYAPGTAAGQDVFHFDYVYGGVPIATGTGSAVTVTIENGAITKAQMRVRSYSLPGAEPLHPPLTELQELAVIEAQGGGEPVLVYADHGSDVAVTWYKEVPNG